MTPTLEPGVRYVVTKGSDDGTLEVGNHIWLERDLILCREAQGWIAPEDTAEAMRGVEVAVETKGTIMTIKNRPEWAGYRATPKCIFGEASRYAVYAMHTQGDNVIWLVDDAEAREWPDTAPVRIREASTLEEAIQDLPETEKITEELFCATPRKGKSWKVY